MKLTRRMFFGTAAAAPLAAKQAAAEAVRAGQLGGTPIGGFGGLPACTEAGGRSPYELANEQLSACLRSGRLPDWGLAEMRIYARARAVVLDDDLLAIRSWSGTARRRVQVERELQRLIAEEIARQDASAGFDGWVNKFRSALFGPAGDAQQKALVPPRGRRIA